MHYRRNIKPYKTKKGVRTFLNRAAGVSESVAIYEINRAMEKEWLTIYISDKHAKNENKYDEKYERQNW